MTGAISTIGKLAASAAGQPENAAQKLAGAQQFEALLIAEMMKSMRQSGGGAFSGTEEDAAGVTTMEMAEQNFAEMLAAQGGLGLAKLIVSGLDRAQALTESGIRSGS